MGFPGGSDGKESGCIAGDPGSILRLGRSSGEGNGYPLQYSCLENSMDRGAWWATIHRVTKRQTWLSDWPGVYLAILISQFVPHSPSPLYLHVPCPRLHLYFCPENWFICTIFLDSMHVFFFFKYVNAAVPFWIRSEHLTRKGKKLSRLQLRPIA